MDIQKDQINFLDVNTILTETGIETTLFCKPTDRNMLLHGSSYHPIPFKCSLPVSQLSQINRICSSEEDYKCHAEVMANMFRQRSF